MATVSLEVPVQTTDHTNARILAVAEDRLAGFWAEPLQEIARRAEVDTQIVAQRIAAMLRAGTIRRVRQTLMSTNLAAGSLVAWQVPAEKLNAAFDDLFQRDPFSGHVVIRSADPATAGAKYRLWTTLKVPQGFSISRHCDFLQQRIGAVAYRLMPARKLFVLGVGHVRRRGLEIGSKSDNPADVVSTGITPLSDLQWRVLTTLKQEFSPDELLPHATPDPHHSFWSGRAAQAQVSLETFHRVAGDLAGQGLVGRFSTFLEHVKPLADGEQVTRYNALFHWAVPAGREIEAGSQVGRFHVLTHAYWREGGPEFNHVNIMAVAHGLDKDLLLAHKSAIDRHLADSGIPVSYTNVFWGGRSEIKPSEISPQVYAQWAKEVGLELTPKSGE